MAGQISQKIKRFGILEFFLLSSDFNEIYL